MRRRGISLKYSQDLVRLAGPVGKGNQSDQPEVLRTFIRRVIKLALLVTWINLVLRRKYSRKTFYELANKTRDSLGNQSPWVQTPEGFVWRHKKLGGKVRFYLGGRELHWVKVYYPYHPFKEAQTLGAFVQWMKDRMSDVVSNIEIQL